MMKTFVVMSAAAATLAASSPALAQFGGGGAPYADLTTGEAVYQGICQGCHMPDGKGATGAGTYPSFAGNLKLKAPAYPIFVVIRGQKAMPDFGSNLNDAQIAGVVNYIRTHFGNTETVMATEADVKQMRPAPK